MMDPALSIGRNQTDENTTSWRCSKAGASRSTRIWRSIPAASARFRARSGSAAGGQLRIPRHRARSERGRHSLPAHPHAGHQEGEKTTVEKLFATGDNSYATTNLGSGSIRIDPKRTRRTAHPGGRRHLQWPRAGAVRGGGQFHVGGNSFIRFNGNRDLFLNMINWLTADEDLISIRPKAPEDRPLNITAQKMNLVFWLSIVIFPLAVVGFGMATWWKRR